ncbi:ferritin-like fold-containing protein [Lacisediminihabitans changchengi]|uniref:Ferritin-like domain-containing protein n=1 Tax=Lacisediminihabitans changchengi TaxID=2787634 RepID=A0A934SSJ9_9MICO|nr:ferritin-like fold-containing protein [Lacisediminihabitans changchengi]MBK4347354.1 hypothetical protein [Lacisediminihabitans changchengi]
MVNWFRRQTQRVVVPRLHSRNEALANVSKVELAELTPELLPFLAQAAYLQLTVFETLSTVVTDAPTARSKEAVSRVAGFSLDKQHRLVVELQRIKGTDAGSAMQPYAERIDAYRDRIRGATWPEALACAYVTAGLLDDFFRRVAVGLPSDASRRVLEIFDSEDGESILVDELRALIEADPKLASPLALWGRRLVGDTLLIVRSALALPADGHSEEERLEPVFTELIAAHTRRMDALGLTA